MIGILRSHIPRILLVERRRRHTFPCYVAVEFMRQAQHQGISWHLIDVITANKVEILSPMLSQKLSDLFMQRNIDCSSCTHGIA